MPGRTIASPPARPGFQVERTVAVRSGTTATTRFSYVERAEPESYQTGDRGPAGGIVFYDKERASDGRQSVYRKSNSGRVRAVREK